MYLISYALEISSLRKISLNWRYWQQGSTNWFQLESKFFNLYFCSMGKGEGCTVVHVGVGWGVMFFFMMSIHVWFGSVGVVRLLVGGMIAEQNCGNFFDIYANQFHPIFFVITSNPFPEISTNCISANCKIVAKRFCQLSILNAIAVHWWWCCGITSGGVGLWDRPWGFVG